MYSKELIHVKFQSMSSSLRFVNLVFYKLSTTFSCHPELTIGLVLKNEEMTIPTPGRHRDENFERNTNTGNLFHQNFQKRGG